MKRFLRRPCHFMAATMTVAVAAGGCGSIGSAPPRPLTADSFVQRKAEPSPSQGPLDKPAPLLYDQVHYDPNPSDQAAADTPGSKEISKTVREAVRPPSDVAVRDEHAHASKPATVPATRPFGGPSTGEFLTIGSVLAQVNDTAVYADKVLAILDRPLQAEAKKSDENGFRRVAADLIQRQVMEFIHAELEFAAAQHSLEAKDEQLAKAETTVWRQRQIAQNGGSVEVAKRKAVEDGTDFDEQCRQHYRLIMTQLYYQRRVFPLIQVSAGDIRRYYEINKEKEFTDPAEAKFRVIKISVKATGDRDKALEKIRRLAARIQSGADFATVAGQNNDDTGLAANQGDVSPGGWMDRNAFRIEKVEKAVWAVQPGQVTDIIDDNDAFYLAKLDQRKGGKTSPFEEQLVQDKIRETLRRQQFNALREKVRTDLEKQAIIDVKPNMMQTALDMVMQRYSRWTGAAAAN